MKTIVNISDEFMKEAMKAVIEGLKELIRQKRIENIVSKAGTLNFSDGWEKARHER